MEVLLNNQNLKFRRNFEIVLHSISFSSFNPTTLLLDCFISIKLIICEMKALLCLEWYVQFKEKIIKILIMGRVKM